MHIAEVVTIAKSLPLLRLNTYKSLILSYSADYRRIFRKNTASVARKIFAETRKGLALLNPVWHGTTFAGGNKKAVCRILFLIAILLWNQMF